MHRLFVAIRPPETVRLQLLGLMGGVSGARWQSDEQVHLTLRFVGEVDRHTAGDIDACLAAIYQPRFEIALSGVGAFERRGTPTALWAGVAPQEPLRVLHKKVDQALFRAGLEPERRAYVPHITLARLKPGAGTIGAFLEAAGSLSSPPFEVSAFALYESRLTPAGAVYTPLETYRLY
jgi:2'-5' RNA ligase